MLIIGIGGLAKDMIGSMTRDDRHRTYYFFDNTTPDVPEKLFGRYPVYRTLEQMKAHFATISPAFNTAIANPLLRYRLNQKARSLGGHLTSIVARYEHVSEFAHLGEGVIVQPYVVISSDVHIGEGVFFNSHTIIGHDVEIGPYCSFGPGVRVLGDVKIGAYSYIGTNAIIYPGVTIGEKVRIGIGKVITEDIPSNQKVI